MKNHSIDIQKVEKEWISRGFQGGLWEDYIHDVDEFVMLVEGEMEIEMKGSSYSLQMDEELLIPANTYHTVRNIGKGKSRWLYSYKHSSRGQGLRKTLLFRMIHYS